MFLGVVNTAFAAGRIKTVYAVGINFIVSVAVFHIKKQLLLFEVKITNIKAIKIYN